MRTRRGNDRKQESVSKGVIGVLRDAAARFRSLKEEADVAIFGERNATKYRRKLEARARILTGLPKKLRREFRGVDDRSLQKVVMLWVEGFASEAREALAADNTFLLAVLLANRDGKVGDKNDLEKLIDSL